MITMMIRPGGLIFPKAQLLVSALTNQEESLILDEGIPILVVRGATLFGADGFIGYSARVGFFKAHMYSVYWSV